MQQIAAALDPIEKTQRSVLPTPLHRLEALSARFGVSLFCKRDDLTGFGFGGNKSRKLDFLVAHAQRQGADTLLAIGANQSNFCRMVAAFGRAADMEVHLVLGGGKPVWATGNYRVDEMLEARIHHVETMDWDGWAKAAAALEEQLTAKGRCVYRMPVGGSTAVGALGYVAAFGEILLDATRLGLEFDTIVHASSSAGTQAGLVVGKLLSGWSGRIVGMSVAKDANRQAKDVRTLAQETLALLRRAHECAGGPARSWPMVPQSDVIVEDGYVGEGYAARTPESDEAMALFSHRCGIFLDRVYTGKAAAGLIDYARKGRFAETENVVFLHTGGNLEIFA
jgi:1-aminocyclopropane-1-carboxylate deaminase/D-cysteine desulfhydrase-like pyridoxal-dependent ACC family enzyme